MCSLGFTRLWAVGTLPHNHLTTLFTKRQAWNNHSMQASEYNHTDMHSHPVAKNLIWRNATHCIVPSVADH
jgi:hypothetical protein